MKTVSCVFALLVSTTVCNAGPMIGGFELPENISGGYVIGAGFGLVGILTLIVFLFVSSSQKRKTQKVQLAYDTQLETFRQSIYRSGSNRA